MDSQNVGGTQSAPNESGPTAAEKNTLMGILSYIGPLVIISYLTSKDNSFVKFHIRQGLVLLVIEVGVWFLGMVLWVLFPLLSLINLAVLVLSIIGIVNVVHGKAKALPLVGSYSKFFNKI